MTSGRFLLFVVFALFVSHSLFAQDKVSYGKVSLEELKMDSYAPDTTAGAVILSDIGIFREEQVTFFRHIRVKILKKSGLDWGNWVFQTTSRAEFKVTVFNLVNGEIVKTKATGDNIYREEVIEDYQVSKVFAPGVTVGSVIDISYSFIGMPFEWRFQERVPVVYSELTLEPSLFVSFSKAAMGFEHIETVSANQWRAKNMPAFKVEPFLNNYSNYITKFNFQLQSIKGFAFHFEYSTTWRTVINRLLDHSRFGDVLTGSAFLNNYAKILKEKDISVDEKITEAYSYIRKNIKWNGRKSVYASETYKSNFNTDHNGNSADINLLLISLLNKAGITTYPVVLSTRDNGLLMEFTPSISRLNYVVAFIQHEKTEMFVDATSEYTKPGILPPYCLNGRGLLVKKDNEQWFSLNRNYTEQRREYIVETVDADGNVKATVTRDYMGYAFLNWMADQEATNFDESIRKNEIEKNNSGISVGAYKIHKKDSDALHGKETIDVDMSGQLIDAGEELILNPFVLFEFARNPFVANERKYPVDLACQKDISTTIIIQLPKEFSVKQLPESIKFINPDGSASFTFLASTSGNSIQVRAQVKFLKHIFDEVEYLELRQFFTQVVKTINSPIHLAKTH